MMLETFSKEVMFLLQPVHMHVPVCKIPQKVTKQILMIFLRKNAYMSGTNGLTVWGSGIIFQDSLPLVLTKGGI